MADIKKIAKKAVDVYTYPVRAVTRTVAGITGAGNKNVNEVYRQMNEIKPLKAKLPNRKSGGSSNEMK